MRFSAACFVCCLAWLFTHPAIAAPVAAQTEPQRTVIRSQGELPVYSYALGMKPSQLLDDEAGFGAFTEEARDNLEALLAAYDIQDAATLRRVHGTLARLAALRGDHDAALRHIARQRVLEDKPAAKVMTSLSLEAGVVAARSGGDDATRDAAFAAQIGRGLAGVPWPTIANEVKQLWGTASIYNPNLLLGMAQGGIDPVYAESGQINQDLAEWLVNLQVWRKLLLPRNEAQLSALGDYIRANDAPKPDIWAARNVSLADRPGLTPVVVGIWDTGMDLALFDGLLWVNPGEVANGRDDDDNGFVDDLHGIGWGEYGAVQVIEPLLPIQAISGDRSAELAALFQGYNDLRNIVDSEAADAARRHIAGLPPEQAGSFAESMTLYMYYGHGTHVAGIAVDGNPAVRLLNIRQDFPHTLQLPPITRDAAEAMARADTRTIEYLKAAGARVVNMSWRFTPMDIERSLEAAGLGGTPEERKAEAMATYQIVVDSLTSAMRDASDILFVPGAGNDDDDVDFVHAIPAGIDLPNVLTVGGVDRAGDEVDFTSSGRLVRVHAHAHQVDSLVPGGDQQSWSGTSMAAPQVTNLAAKLIALDPSLDVAGVVKLILDGADRSEDGRRNLINPRRSIELLAQRRP